MKRAHGGGGVDYERPEKWRLTKGEEEIREKREKEKKKEACRRKEWDGGLRTTSFPKSCFHYLRLVGSISPP